MSIIERSPVYRRYTFGEWHPAEHPLSVQDIERLMATAEARFRELSTYPLDKILRLIGRVREAWKDPRGENASYLREHLPAETGFSAPMLELAIQELGWVLDPERLRRKLETEMRGIPRSPDFRMSPGSATSLSWSPLGTVLHVLSGNVFLVGAGSLLEGLITGNVTILKASSGERTFLPRLIETIIACDEDGVVSRSIALIDYRSKEREVIDTLKQRVDGIVVWGGEDAVRAYRDNLPARSRLVVFGPKLSVALATAEGIAHYGIARVAERLATEISLWDQNACTAPQAVYVAGEAAAQALLDATAKALEVSEVSLPAGPADLDTAVEIQKLRSVFEIAEIRGKGGLRQSRQGVDWTLLLDPDLRLEPSPLHRTLRILPYREVGEVIDELRPLRGYLQTVGVAAGAGEGLRLARELSQLGANRVLELGQMSGGEIDDPHDGAYDLPQLVNLVVTRLPEAWNRIHPVDRMDPDERAAIIDERLRYLVDWARKSGFYGERLRGTQVLSTADLPGLPRLTRAEMDANMAFEPCSGNAPEWAGLQSTSYQGGYVARSGGSTGKPKFSIYDGRDWEAMIAHGVRVLEGAGLRAGDRVANCMMAGDLYGSFVSFDHINCRVGATTFAFAGLVTPESFVDMWRRFGINVIEAVPTLLVPLLREAKRIEPGLRVEKILYAGTPLSRSDRAWLEENIRPDRISSIIGANEGGQLAYQCERQRDGFHHLVDDFNYVEIVDEDGKRVPDGAPGRILITSLLKYAFPLLRYELGDAGRIVPDRCTCGRTSRVIEYLGRADDGICIGSANLEYRDFRRALEGQPISAMQLVGRNEPAGEYLLFRVETESSTAELGPRLVAAIEEKIPKVRHQLETRLLLRLEVECVPAGAIPRNPRSGKIRNVVDERS